MFNWSREFEHLGYKKELVTPDIVDTPLKEVLFVMLDFAQIEQKKFFEIFPRKTSKLDEPIDNEKNKV